MFNGKYTTLARVIENISRDTEYDNELYTDDIREWAIRAMNLIGVNLTYEKAVDTVSVVDFRTEIPTNLVELISIRDKSTGRMLSSSTDDFIITLHNDKVSNSETEHIIEPEVIPAYKIVNGYIFYNFDMRDVEIVYTKYMVDNNGCIMIPDVDRYLMAIEAFVIFKVDSKLYRRGLIGKDIKFESEQNWLWYVNSAANKLVTPDYGVAENLNKRAQAISGNSGAYSNGFKTLNTPTIKRF